MSVNHKPAVMCTMCFASDADGSWGEVTTLQHCLNCGAGGSQIQIPTWAVEALRENASWVGKRAYPNDEDKEGRVELDLLRGLVTEHAGRTVRLVDGLKDGEPKRWWVTQAKGTGRNTAVIVDAPDAAAALFGARLQLPYVDPKALG